MRKADATTCILRSVREPAVRLVAGVEFLRGLLQGLRGRWLPLRLHVVFLLADGVKEQRMPANVHVGLRNLPVVLPDHPSLDIEGPAAIEPAENAPANQDILAELSSQRNDAVPLFGDNHLALHDAHD